MHQPPEPPPESQPQVEPAVNAGLRRWRCPNCGQTVFAQGDQPPPDRCAYCNDLTTWRALGPAAPSV